MKKKIEWKLFYAELFCIDEPDLENSPTQRQIRHSVCNIIKTYGLYLLFYLVLMS